jgi:hypothetical protein
VLKKLSFLLLPACCVSILLLGQSGNATLTGLVTDQSGAMLRDAVITVTNQATNVAHTTQSNSEGRYLVSGLIPGTYRLSCDFAGFKKFEHTGTCCKWAIRRR